MAWFVLSLLSVFALATAELVQQHLLNTKNAFSERASAVLTFLFQSLLVLPGIFFLSLQSEIFGIFNQELRWKVLFVTILASISMIFYLRSFKVKNISFSAIFVSGSTIVSTMLGIIFLNEEVYPSKFIGIGLVLSAIIILNLQKGILEKNHYYGILAGVMFGMTYTLDKSMVLLIHPLVYIFWAFLLVAIFGFLFNPKDVLRSLNAKKFNDYKPVIFSGIAYSLYNFFTFSAYRLGGEVGKIDAINNTQIFLIIIFEFFFLKQAKSIKLKILTSIIATVGVVILGMH